MTDKKIIKAIIHYKDFLALDENQIRTLFENKYVEFLISIKKDEYKNLKTEEKKKLYGFRLTEREPLKKPVIDSEKMFVIKDLSEIKGTDIKIIEQSFKEKHRKYSRPPVPRKILNPNFNSHKKGGR